MTISLEKVMEQSFLDYSAYVIQRRAIPDARDMIKFSARQILHAQHLGKLDAKHPFKKSQKSVAAATSFSYVHGDVSAYEQIIRMGRNLVQRYKLEEINGNGGTPINSKDYAAPRYTEARLSSLASQLFEMIGMNTVAPTDWEETYDGEGTFPKVLPTVGYYNICNGSFGSIAPTMVSSVPQFNIREVNNAIIDLISDPSAEVDILPDFASGGILLNPGTTRASLAAGEGKSALLRGRIRRGTGYVDVIELPYGVYTNTVCNELQKAIDSGKSPVHTFKDLSKRTVNIRVYGGNLDELEEWLYKNTSVQRHFTIKMIMLDKGKTPKLFTLKSALLAHIEHAKGVYRKATEYELQQLKNRAEVLEGLIRAQSMIDAIIAMIKASSGRAEAILHLISDEPFKFTRLQAEAIVDLRLHRLSSMDVAKLQEELDANLLNQEKLNEILVNAQRFNEVLTAIYEKTSLKYGDNRRTEIHGNEDFESTADGSKADREFSFTWLHLTYDATTNASDHGDSGRIIELNDELIIVTNLMRGFTRKATEIPMGAVPWEDVIKLKAGETVVWAGTRADFEGVTHVEMKDAKASRRIDPSYILVGASKRGKLLVTGKQNVLELILCGPH